MQFNSSLIQEAVDQISALPGIGKKTALRLVLHLLKQEEHFAIGLADAIIKLRTQIKYCKQCHDIADDDLCTICANKNRDHSIICIVEDSPDVIAIENTSQYKGLYHVLGGVISPMDGIGPSQLNIDSLIQRISDSDEISEIIFALSPNMEGDTTAFFLSKKLKSLGVKVTSIARGIPIGSELEYTDEITLGRSIQTRIVMDSAD
jgi:recombination protein RecR